MVAILCLLSVPLPIRILLDNAREVLLFAPDQALTKEVEQRIGNVISNLPQANLTVRLLKMGSKLNILAHIVLPQTNSIDSVSQMDTIRVDIARSLDDMEIASVVDVLFTSNPSLAD